MELKLDFNWEIRDRLDFANHAVPDHTMQALEMYFLRGVEPGGHVSALLAGDVWRAVQNADMVNKHAMWATLKCITEFAPGNSYGSYEAIKEWCKPKNKDRLAFKEEIEKQYAWRKLQNGKKTKSFEEMLDDMELK